MDSLEKRLGQIDWVYWLGVALLFVGWFLALAPHAYHTQVGLIEDQPHDTHFAEGMAAVAAGLVLLYWRTRPSGRLTAASSRKK